jgi:hypothetical protein
VDGFSDTTSWVWASFQWAGSATQDDELKSHFDAGFKRLVDEIVQRLRPTHQSLLMTMGDCRAEVLALTATVAEMRDTIKSLTAQIEGLPNELQTAHEKLNDNCHLCP